MPSSAIKVFGEVLFDCLPDGQDILGGAPFNVAWNLSGLGVDVEFISAVGNDSRGDTIREAMQDWGMGIESVQINGQSTGVVNVSFKDGHPEYEIAHPVAWDRIDVPPSGFSPSQWLYLGSLAYRDPHNHSAVESLVEAEGSRRFVDINIRHPWFDERWLNKLIHRADVVKVSEGELSEVMGGARVESDDQIFEAAEAFQGRFQIGRVLVTAGSQGAFVIEEGRHRVEAMIAEPIVDTVGAGDAFSSATLLGLLSGAPLAVAARPAAKFAARVCGLAGATTHDRDFYHL
ncbi:MAG: PfkB family carbohydrate kinase [Planctomycetota bacterium]